MPEIKVISRSVGDRKGYHRNFSPHEHRFARGREYIRAVKYEQQANLDAVYVVVYGVTGKSGKIRKITCKTICKSI